MKKRGLFLLIILFSAVCLFAQHSFPDTIIAKRINKLHFDGHVDDTAWQDAFVVTNFTQRELDFGKPATSLTKAAVLYDELAMYIGVWCYQRKDKLTAKFYQRDFDFDTEDNFEVIISPFNDKRNGYLFVINPNGARADLQISGQESSNISWNGVWDARTSITDSGWFAEIRIPFTTLQFKKQSEHIWAINFERNIRYKNEQVLWQGWDRNYEIENIAQAGTLTGIRQIGYARRFELKPYSLLGFENISGTKTQYPGKLGADLNINISPTLKANLTTNTDFAQVEADRIAVNLTRFNLLYPEKRDFFLEGYQNYGFNLGGNNELFYTRKIGIENFEQVSIIAGARLFGKIGRNNIGLLSLQTAATDHTPATNNSVFRYRRDIGLQSYIGGILTSKTNSLIGNQVAGIDGAFTTSKLLGNKNLVIGGEISKSFDRGLKKGDDYSWNVFVDYPNDQIDNFIGVRSIQSNYNPELGFLERSNFDNFRWFFRLTPRWFSNLGIRKMAFRPWGFEYYRTHTTGELESFLNESRPLGFFTKSGERFEFNLYQQFDRLDNGFDLTSSIKIPSGKYWMYRNEIQAGTFQGRRFWVDMIMNWGDFYTGHISTYQGSVGWNLNKHLNLKTNYTLNKITSPQGNVTTHELAEYVSYAFNPRLDMSSFIQWNSLDDLLLGNFRLHWIPNIGSDLYVVYNRGYENLKYFSFMRPSSSTGAAKLVWRITF